eukprot:scaffold109133_cov28-Tisochrysis_lutea.AAC.3
MARQPCRRHATDFSTACSLGEAVEIATGPPLSPDHGALPNVLLPCSILAGGASGRTGDPSTLKLATSADRESTSASGGGTAGIGRMMRGPAGSGGSSESGQSASAPIDARKRA